MAQKRDFIIVDTPHDPRSLSGSDAHSEGKTSVKTSIDLACWYKMDQQMYVTGSQDSGNYFYLDSLKDCSTQGTERDLKRANDLFPIRKASGSFSASTDGGYNVGAGYFINGSQNESYRSLYMRNSTQDAGFNIAPGGTATGAPRGSDWWSPWLSGSTSGTTQRGETAIMLVMRYNGTDTAQGRRFMFTYGSRATSDDGNDGEHASFSFGLDHDRDESDQGSRKFLIASYRNNSGTQGHIYGRTRNLHNGFHILTMVYASSSTEQEIKMYANGEHNGSKKFISADSCPSHEGQFPLVMLGGHGRDWGGGYANGAQYDNSIAEIICFDNGLSEIRRQQMERYLSNKYELPLTASQTLHSEFVGRGQGRPFLTSSLTNIPATSSGGKYVRQYTLKTTSSYQNKKFQHETAGGLFARPSLSGSAFSHFTASSGISNNLSLRAWVMAENLTHTNHTGSQIALVAKATSPYGNKMDNIKGYALKFGTFKNGHDTNSLKIRLSRRSANMWSDGEHSGFGDTDLSPSFTPTAGKWYQLRLDVLGSGSLLRGSTTDARDIIKTYAREHQTGSWQLLNTTEIANSAQNFRYRPDHTGYDATKVSSSNGLYNGYYVSVSSSTGDYVDTKYYIDNFEIITASGSANP